MNQLISAPYLPPYITYAVTASAAGRSMFVRGSWKTLAAAIDGTSNTIIVSETAATTMGDNRLAAASCMNGVPSLDTNPLSCLNYLDAGNRKFLGSAYSYAGNTSAVNTFDAQRGYNVYMYSTPWSYFCTVLPPNSPNCASGSRDSWGVLSATSNHPGGVNVGLLDGSAKFVSDTVNAVSNNLTGSVPAQVSAGPSEFGIWGAMGSVNGGESVAF